MAARKQKYKNCMEQEAEDSAEWQGEEVWSLLLEEVDSACCQVSN